MELEYIDAERHIYYNDDDAHLPSLRRWFTCAQNPAQHSSTHGSMLQLFPQSFPNLVPTYYRIFHLFPRHYSPYFPGKKAAISLIIPAGFPQLSLRYSCVVPWYMSMVSIGLPLTWTFLRFRILSYRIIRCNLVQI